MEGWIKNFGSMPVIPSYTPVDALFADGDVIENREASYWSWHRIGAPSDITHWRLHKEVDADGYTVWGGGERPVSRDTMVEYKLRSGAGCEDLAGDLWWEHRQENSDIVAYKVVGKAAPKISMPYAPDLFIEVPEIEPATQAPDTNPKRSLGLQSVPLHLWSDLASAYGALALYDGAGRYGTNNYKATKVDASIYLAAMRRHIASWSEGEECDPVTGVPHLGAVLANVAILLEARAAGSLIDDRNIGTGWLQERDNLKEIVKQVAKANEGREPRHYTRKEN